MKMLRSVCRYGVFGLLCSVVCAQTAWSFENAFTLQNRLPHPSLRSTSRSPHQECNTPSVRISAIQGDREVSPMNGEVVTVEAIVSAVFNGPDQLKGYFLIEDLADQDKNPATSEGLFVYHPTPNAIQPYHRVRITAKVKEFKGLTELTQVQQWHVCGQVSQLPPAAELPLPFNTAAQLEAIESMPIAWPKQGLVVADLKGYARYGSVIVSTEPLWIPTQVALPGEPARQVQQQNQQRRIVFDDGRLIQYPRRLELPAPYYSAHNRIRVGDRLVVSDQAATNEAVFLLYAHNAYRLIASKPLSVQQDRRSVDLMPRKASADIRVASFNVLNFFNGDGQGGGFPTARGAQTLEELERQKTKVLAALAALDADVIGLMEIENDGYEARSAIAELTQLLAAQTRKPYRFVQPQRTQRLGEDVISVALIYHSGRVAPQGSGKSLTSTPFARHNRVPIAQRFLDPSSGEMFNVVVNHWKSRRCKGAQGINANQGDGQGCWNPTRLEAAKALICWLRDQPQSLILGDLNAYAQEDPIRFFSQANFTNLLPKNRFTYVYKGERGTLDYAFADQALAQHLVQAQVWSINAAEADVLDYHLKHKSPQQRELYYAPNEIRSSDHDPVVVDFRFSGRQRD